MRHRGLVWRRLLVTTCTQSPSAPRWDVAWGSGASGPRKPGDRWWGQPQWLAPRCNFKFSARVLRLRKRTGRALVIGWITKRWPLGTDEPYAPRVRPPATPNTGKRVRVG